MKRELWLRRHAVQIAAQLPEGPADALAVLEYARIIVESFLNPQSQVPDLKSVGSSPRRFAISIVKPDESPK